MKSLFLLLTVMNIYLQINLQAQVKTNFNNINAINASGKFMKQYNAIIDYTIPAKNIPALLKADSIESTKSQETKPFQLAVPVEVDLDIAELIRWNYDKEFAFGKYTVKLDGALSASINFDKFYLPKGTEMYIYNENGAMITGPVTDNENNTNNVWGSWVYKDGLITIEIKTPLSTIKEFILHSNNVAYGYREIYKTKAIGFGNSGPCEINVLCPLGNGWEPERNSVALILNANGSYWCSGSMVMNTCNTNRPFFLTANHCFNPPGLPQQDVTKWRFNFQDWSPTCSPSQNADGVTYNGSTLRANWANSDFCLVELINTPPLNSGINYGGWTTSNAPAQNATAIHHPSGDLMKISRSDNPVSVASAFGTTNQHWRANWSSQNNGAGQTVTPVTEGGSSGSPLFDQNHRIVGQLHGGPSVCTGSSLWDFYGRFDISWSGGGTNATRLSNWLDPGNTVAMTTNTTNVSALVNASLSLSMTGHNSFCTGTSTYTVNGVPAGAEVTWVSSNTSVATVTPAGNPATVTKVGNGNVTIAATVGGNCLINNTVSKMIAVGIPSAQNISLWNSANSTMIGQPVGFVVGYPPANRCQIMAANWQVISMGANILEGNFPCPNENETSKNIFFQSTGTAYIQARIQNTCGWSNWSAPVPIQVNSNYFIIAPNPAANAITITAKENTNQKDGIREIRVYDNTGNFKKQTKYSAGTRQARINVADLKTGIYILEISSGENKERQQIAIQK